MYKSYFEISTVKSYERRKNTDSYWHSKSEDFLYSASILWDNLEKGGSWDVYKMLMGLAFELLFKAICVQKETKFDYGHDLRKLAEFAQVELSEEEKDILDILTEYIIWDAKYPVPKKPSKLQKHWQKQHKCLNDVYSEADNLALATYNHKLDWGYLHPFWLRLSESYQFN